MKIMSIAFFVAIFSTTAFAADGFIWRSGEGPSSRKSALRGKVPIDCMFEVSKFDGGRKTIFEKKFSGEVGERTNYISFGDMVDGRNVTATLVYNVKGSTGFGDDRTVEENVWAFITSDGKRFARADGFSSRGEDQALPAKFSIRMDHVRDDATSPYVFRLLCEADKRFI